LIGVWEIDIDAVNGVNRKLQFLEVCSRHFNYDQNNVYSKGLKDQRSTEKSQIHCRICFFCNKNKIFFSRRTSCIEHTWIVYNQTLQIPCCRMALCPAIDQSLYTENTSNSQEVRYICCQCYEKNDEYLHIRMENFDLDSSFAPSQLPSLFVVTTIFKIKRLIQKSKKYEEFEKLLALEVLRSRTSLAPCKSTLEYPNSLQQYYEIIPKCLTSFFDGLVLTLQLKKYEIVKQKQKECKSAIAEFNKSETEKLTQIFNQLIMEYPLGFAMDEINTVLKEAVRKGCNVSLPTVVILEAGPVPNSNLAVHKTCEMYIKGLKLNQ
ncbi:5849_t:CDS:2, partial [Cetraspora pellucida]